MEQTTKAILVVSFGTSHADTREKTIDRIEEKIREHYPQYRIYRAWTSNIIRRKLAKRDHVQIDSVDEALERMKRDGMTEVIVQPTHMLNGIENDKMCASIRERTGDFESLRIGSPLLTSQEDTDEVVRILQEQWKDLPEDEVLVLMGHGTEHYSNSIYAALDYTLKDRGCANLFMGTVEAYPSMDSLLRQVQALHPKKIHIAPFMIVAGDHAKNDMAGDDPDSWKNQFQKVAPEVCCHLVGMGEYEDIQKLFVRHVGEAK